MTEIYDYQSPIGTIRLQSNHSKLNSASFVEDLKYKKKPKCEILQSAIEQLDKYFSGKKISFDIPMEFTSGTQFQRDVWIALQSIPYGETISYKDLAQKVENPKAARAVGNANNKNPMVVFIPCHRVVGSKGDLVGYASGVDKKSFLLELEHFSR